MRELWTKSLDKWRRWYLKQHLILIAIGSMCGIFTYIWLVFMVNVGVYKSIIDGWDWYVVAFCWQCGGFRSAMGRWVILMNKIKGGSKWVNIQFNNMQVLLESLIQVTSGFVEDWKGTIILSWKLLHINGLKRYTYIICMRIYPLYYLYIYMIYVTMHMLKRTNTKMYNITFFKKTHVLHLHKVVGNNETMFPKMVALMVLYHHGRIRKKSPNKQIQDVVEDNLVSGWTNPSEKSATLKLDHWIIKPQVSG